jgi:hypothetical protein
MANIRILYKYLKQKKLGVAQTSFSDSALSITDYGDFRSDYLGEYNVICKTVLAC